MSYRQARTKHDKIKLVTYIQYLQYTVYIQHIKQSWREKKEKNKKINVYQLHNTVTDYATFFGFLILKFNFQRSR